MKDEVLSFYEELADYYHLMFADWDQSIELQANVIAQLLFEQGVTPGSRVLDCACGIGTQALGLASRGYRVTGSDLSPAAVKRAEFEARHRSLNIDFYTADMASLREVAGADFDAAIAMDNALPHMKGAELELAVVAIAGTLKPDGVFVASIRDYDRLVAERPDAQPPVFYGTQGNRRIVHQVWEWTDERTYTPHLYITREEHGGWATLHVAAVYHCILRSELTVILEKSGFREVHWLMPGQSHFYQPMVVARR